MIWRPQGKSPKPGVELHQLGRALKGYEGGGSFNFAPEQEFGNNGGYLVFIATFGHYFQLLAQPRLIPQVPAFFSEVFMQAFTIRRGGDPAAGQAQFDRCVGRARAAFGELSAKTLENYASEIVVAEKLETLSKLGVTAIEGSERNAARIQIALAFNHEQRVVSAAVADNVQLPAWRGRPPD